MLHASSIWPSASNAVNLHAKMLSMKARAKAGSCRFACKQPVQVRGFCFPHPMAAFCALPSACCSRVQSRSAAFCFTYSRSSKKCTPWLVDTQTS